MAGLLQLGENFLCGAHRRFLSELCHRLGNTTAISAVNQTDSVSSSVNSSGWNWQRIYPGLPSGLHNLWHTANAP